MSRYCEDQKIKGVDYAVEPIGYIEFETCEFLNCSFVGVDLASIRFSNCRFEDCDFSNAKIHDTAFQVVEFVKCKLLGLHFDSCSSFALELSFADCVLNYCTFYQMKLEGQYFKNCELKEVDFTETNLAKSKFDNCDLERAVFERTNLELVDFRTAFNYSIHPEGNRMKKTKFSLAGIKGLLDRYSIEIE